MKKSLLIVSFCLLLGLGIWVAVFSRSGTPGISTFPSQAAANAFSKKLSLLTSEKTKPVSRTLEFSQAELDGYLFHHIAPLFPKGLQDVRIQLLDGSLEANSKINFDEYEKSAAGAKNSLLTAMLSGEHTLDVFADFKSENRMGSYEVSKVLLDQKEIPKPLVDLLIQKYVVPKYPAAKPNSPFPLPYQIEKLDILRGKLVVHQTP
jgi:hypothetical protein